MDAKPAFDDLFGAFRFGVLLPLVLYTVKPDDFRWKLCNIDYQSAQRK